MKRRTSSVASDRTLLGPWLQGEDIEAVVQHVIDAALEKYPGQIDTITKVSVEIGCDDDEDCDDSDDSCDCLADDCDCPEVTPNL